MMARRTVGVTLAVSAALLTGPMGLARPQAPLPVLPSRQTIADLKIAYRRASFAHARYTEYALKAQEEGYGDAAALFQAASEAERIHARNHRTALLKLGVQPEAGFYRGTPGSTPDNLWNAIASESYERDVIFPEMIRHATVEGQTEAVRSFTYALHAERQHVILFRRAWEGLWNGNSGTVYYVAPTCGATYASAPPVVCPLCGTPASRFARFN